MNAKCRHCSGKSILLNRNIIFIIIAEGVEGLRMRWIMDQAVFCVVPIIFANCVDEVPFGRSVIIQIAANHLGSMLIVDFPNIVP